MVNLCPEDTFNMMEWISMMLTALASGGLAGFGSLWYARRKSKAETIQAESQAAASWQSVYKEIIEDLRGSRDAQRVEIRSLEAKIGKLKEEVEQNARKLAWLIPLTCCVKDCKDRVVFVDGQDFTKRGRKPKAAKECQDCDLA